MPLISLELHTIIPCACVCVCVGCITEETLKEDLKLLREVHPEVDEVTLKKQNQYMWRNFYNNGQDTPKGKVAMS